ncbi:cbb3-type cytochrome c oxidase subunit 3 [Hyphomonadaceae bacterium ML37]|nr:cbb3-type cytochrome c oxidase subunit 3 [Hyphomonadaceae bacterium ML37]
MYEALASFAQTWGLVAFMIFFIGVIAYAVWPKNKDKFNAAAKSVLDENPRPAEADEQTDTKDGRDG